MPTQEIIATLGGRGISVTRKTLYRDIELLNKYGYDVICVRGRSNRYFVGERKFERPEIQVLLNAIGATPIPRSCNSFLINISVLRTESVKKKKLAFRYFDYGINGKREYRKNGRRYVINPLGMAFSDNQLYLIGYHDTYDDIAHYRIDRMDEAEVTKKDILSKKEFENFDLNAYRQELFDMYAGEQCEVELLFPQDLLEIAIDRFGEGITPISAGNGEYIVEATVQVSKTFFAWITTFEGKVKILSPDSVHNEYVEFVKKLL